MKLAAFVLIALDRIIKNCFNFCPGAEGRAREIWGQRHRRSGRVTGMVRKASRNFSTEKVSAPGLNQAFIGGNNRKNIKER